MCTSPSTPDRKYKLEQDRLFSPKVSERCNGCDDTSSLPITLSFPYWRFDVLRHSMHDSDVPLQLFERGLKHNQGSETTLMKL
jgi:hypothetical protein